MMEFKTTRYRPLKLVVFYESLKKIRILKQIVFNLASSWYLIFSFQLISSLGFYKHIVETLDIYELLHRMSSRIIRVAVAYRLVQEFRTELPPKVKIKNKTSSVYSRLLYTVCKFLKVCLSYEIRYPFLCRNNLCCVLSKIPNFKH